MSGLAAPVPAHAALFEHRLGVAHHLRIATEHGVRVLGCHRQASPSLEAPVADGFRNASDECPAMRFATHEWREAEPSGARARDLGDDLTVGEVCDVAYSMDEDDSFELVPCLLSAQDRQERSETGASRETPER